MIKFEEGDRAHLLEGLEKLENSVIELEELINGASDYSSLVHIIFREAHNLKSNLVMLGLPAASAVIHSVENVFDDIRNGRKKAQAFTVQKVLELVDRLKIAVDAAEDLENPDELIASVSSVQADEKQEEDVYQFSKEETALLEDAFIENLNFFLAEKLIKTDISEENFSRLPVYDEIAKIGKIIKISPDYSGINRSREEDVVRIFFTTAKSEDDLFFIIFDPLKQLPFPASIKKRFETMLVNSRKIRALVVDDNPLASRFHQHLLSEVGEADYAKNGKEGLSYFTRAVRGNKPYDLMLLDVKMPDVEGTDVLSCIRHIEDENGILGLDRCRVFMVSDVDELGTVKQTFKDQADAYLIKPLSKYRLYKELAKLKNFYS